jgi:hypothetical protein
MHYFLMISTHNISGAYFVLNKTDFQRTLKRLFQTTMDLLHTVNNAKLESQQLRSKSFDISTVYQTDVPFVVIGTQTIARLVVGSPAYLHISTIYHILSCQSRTLNIG